MDIVVVIPARMGSTRFPGKPLHLLAGKPMVQWVYEAARRAKYPKAVVIATPDEEIVHAAKRFGAECVRTRPDHETGTDRIAEASKILKNAAYINVQGDEPLIAPETIDACAEPLIKESAEMSSIYDVLPNEEESESSVVKVVTDLDDFALYFSRSPIPFRRNGGNFPMKKHIGVYAYTSELLARFSRWEPTPLERAEKLEQLRFLEHGVKIQMRYAKGTRVSVDTPEQAVVAERFLREVIS